MILEKWLLTTPKPVLESNPLYMWGLNDDGQLGTGFTSSVSSPALVGVSTELWDQLAMGENHSLAIKSDGKLFAWGKNNLGQLGDGTTISKSSPVQIGTSNWSQVSTRKDSSYAITQDKRLFSWGNNRRGELGLDTILVIPESWSQISAGGIHTAAIRSDGALFTWGSGNTWSTG
jgi:alpha-tubulin suppressor-like RCC1 family protein